VEGATGGRSVHRGKESREKRLINKGVQGGDGGSRKRTEDGKDTKIRCREKGNRKKSDPGRKRKKRNKDVEASAD